MKRIIYAICLILICECSTFEDKRMIIKPKPEIVSPEVKRHLAYLKWMVLATQVEKRYDTTGWTTEEIATELSFQAYLIGID